MKLRAIIFLIMNIFSAVCFSQILGNIQNDANINLTNISISNQLEELKKQKTSENDPLYPIGMSFINFSKISNPKLVQYTYICSGNCSAYSTVTDPNYIYFFDSNNAKNSVIEKIYDKSALNFDVEKESARKMKINEQERSIAAIKKSIDIVAQVLNYSDGCDDEGCGGYSSWIVSDAKSCIYDKVNFRDGSVIKTLNLNQMDPKSIQVATMNRASTERKEVHDPYNAVRIIGYNNVVTKYQTQDVLYMGKEVFSQQNLDINRLKRGWTLIYSKYCLGTRKAF